MLIFSINKIKKQPFWKKSEDMVNENIYKYLEVLYQKFFKFDAILNIFPDFFYKNNLTYNYTVIYILTKSDNFLEQRCLNSGLYRELYMTVGNHEIKQFPGGK